MTEQPTTAETISLKDVTDIQFSTMCLQGPCLHSVKITVAGRSEPIVARDIIGHKIARMLCVIKRRTGAHFNWFLEEEGWKSRTQNSHMNQEPIQIGSFIFTYPEGYKSKEMKPIKPPRTRPKKRGNDDEPSEEGMLYARSHGIQGGLISLREAKAMVKFLKG